MDSIFGRKKKSRQINEILTSSGGASGSGSAEVVGNSMPSQYSASTSNGSGRISSQALDPRQQQQQQYGEEFYPRGSSSGTGPPPAGHPQTQHRRTPSGASASVRTMRSLTTDYARDVADPGNSSRLTNSSSYTSSDSASQRYPTMTSEIIKRMSTASAASTSLGQPRTSLQSGSMPRDSSIQSSMSRASNGAVSQQPPGEKAEFIMPRPSDAEIERMFADLMNKRDFLGLPGGGLSDEYKDAARKNMMNFPIHKKWMLVYNDKFTEFHAEREKERSRRNHTSNQQGPIPANSLVITRNSPEWYIKKFMDGSVTTKHIESLAVTLRTCAMGWVENFVDAKGTPVLASFLNGLHAKGVKSDVDVALEYETLKAFRSLFNSKAGANDALSQPKCVISIVHSVISSHLATRKQAADILLFLCHWAIPAGHRLVLRGFDELKTAVGDHGRFDAWFRVFEQTIDGRGQMGSRVGASDEVRKISVIGHQEASLNEYAVNNMFLVNAMLSTRIVSEYEVRVHLRNQMEASGLQRILIKLRAFKNPDLDRQIDEFTKGAEGDHENVVESFNRDVLTDMNDPVDVFKAIVGKVSGSRAYDFFLSALQHFLLIKQDGESLVHYYQLIDSMVTSVVMDRKGSVEGNDISSLLGVSVNNVLSRFADQDAMNATRDELQRARAEARNAQMERARLEEQMKQTGEGLVGQLQEQIHQLENDLDVARGNTSAMQRDMEEMEKGYVDRIVALEVQSRELYDMLKGAQGTAEMLASNNGSMDRQKLVDTLEKQMERNKTIRKLEANARKEGRMAQLTNEQKMDEVREREKRRSRKRMSRKSIGALAMGEEQIEVVDAHGEDSGSDSSDINPQSDANKWKIQATLAAGMAANADLQSRMTDAKETRRRKQGRRSDQTSETRDSPASEIPPPPPPPPPPMSSGGGATFLDEIRNRKLGSRSPSSAETNALDEGGMAPPPPPPPPPAPPAPPPPPVDVSRPPSIASSAATDVPPPPPPPPPGPEATLLQTPQNRSSLTQFQNTPVDGTPGNTNRDSMLNVRASYQGNIGPTGPAHAPPAPPLNLAASVVMRKEVLEVAKTRMKQLQWDKLTPQHAAETVWGQQIVEEDKLTEMLREKGLFEEMEEDFKAKQINKRSTTTAAKKDKTDFKTHLTLQTRQGIEMVLRRVKSSLTDAKHATPEEVAHHIVNCNEAVLDQSFLTELLRHYPESETKGQLGEYRNASDEELRLLHPADRLVVLLMTVPHLKDKVKGLLYLSKYRESVEMIKEGSLKIREGSEKLVDAPHFAKLLNLILMMGNFLNSSGMQGGAFGFKITSINKLVDTKAGDGTTLLHFVERSISRCFPETEAFLDELEKPNEACRVQLLDLKRDLAELKSGSIQHKKELDRFIDENEERLDDPYTKLMLPFLSDVQVELTRLSDLMQLSERTYVEALKYFGEGPDPQRRGFPAVQPMRTEDFFGVFREFSAAYRKVKVDNARLAELRSAEAKRRAAAEERERERQEAVKRKEAGLDDSAVLETLLGNLRSGATTPKRKRKTDRRNTGPRESGRGSTGGGDKDTSPAGEDQTGANVSTAASSGSIDGNPSDVAQAMLAKLQGSGGGAGQSAPREGPPTPYSTRRRRERRVTAGHRLSVSGDGTGASEEIVPSAAENLVPSFKNAPSAASDDAPSSDIQDGFTHSKLDDAKLLEPPNASSDVQRISMEHTLSQGGRSLGDQEQSGTEHFTDAESEGSHYSGATDEKETQDAASLNDGVDEGNSALSAIDRVARRSSADLHAGAEEDETALVADGNMSGEMYSYQGEWFDPDASGFMNTSTNSADRTARP